MPRLLALGEIMVEVAPATDGLHRVGYAGDTFNTAWYARRLLPAGWTVGYATVLGQDAVSDAMAAFMKDEGIDISAVRRHPDRTVGLYMITLDRGERSFSYWRSQSAAKTLADDAAWLARVLHGADWLYVSGITLAILSPDRRRALCGALSAARGAGARVVLDTNLRLRLWESPDAAREGLMQAARCADVILPSFDEDGALFRDADAQATIDRYRGAGARLVAVKNGPGVCTVWHDGATTEIQPPKAEQVDSTAAGDSFGAGLVAGLAQGRPVPVAVTQACALAARVVGAPGALVPGAAIQGAGS